MNAVDILEWIGIIVLLAVCGYITTSLVIISYDQIHSYRIMQNECEINSDICFCNYGECTIKSSCSYSQFNNGPTIGGCNHTRLCAIFKKANWKEGLWDYDCNN